MRYELILDNKKTLDVKEGSPFPITYQIDDVRNPASTNASYSKTIQLAGSKNNNDVLGHLYDINSDFTYFNPNIKTKVQVYIDYILVMDGYFRLNSIDRNLDTGGVVYNITIFEDTTDLWRRIDGLFVKDMDLSSLNHTISYTNITNTWGTGHTYQDGYMYPMPMPKNPEHRYVANDFKPAIYHRWLLEKIVTDAGYKVGGDFFTEGNEQFYNKEVIPLTNTAIETDKTILDARKFKVAHNGSTNEFTFNIPASQSTLSKIHQLSFTNESPPNFDNNNLWQGGNRWVVSGTGLYNLDIDLQSTLDLNPQGISTGTTVYLQNINTDKFSDYKLLRANIRATLNNTDTILDYTTFVSMPESLVGNTDTAVPINIKGKLFNNVVFQTGDQIRLYVSFEIPENFGYAEVNTILGVDVLTYRQVNCFLSISSNSNLSANATANVYVDGDTIDIVKYVPATLKQSEVLLDLQRRYNLYFQLDEMDDTKILFQTRDEFYSAGETLDWSNKKDLQIDSIELLTDLQDKKVLFTYKQDSDDANDNYTKSTGGDIYGQKRIEFTNEFTDSEKKVETPFGNTCLVKSDNVGLGSMILPYLEGAKTPRVLIYGSNLTAGNNLNWSYRPVNREDALETNTIYPFCGHFDNPFNPTYSILFGNNNYYYYNSLVSDTNNNLHNRYWKNYVESIAEGKMLKAKTKIDVTDIEYLRTRLNTKLWLGDSNYLINKIIDFDGGDKLTAIELIKYVPFSKFIKINETPIVVPQTLPETVIDSFNTRTPKVEPVRGEPILTGTTNPADGGRISPTTTSGALVSGVSPKNEVLSSDAIVMGSNNSVKENSSNIMVTGNNNLVSENTTNVSLLNSSNNIVQASNAILFNTSGKTITSENEMWIGEEIHIKDGQLMFPKEVVGGKDSTISGKTSGSTIVSGRDNKIIADTVSGDTQIVNSVIVGGSGNTIQNTTNTIMYDNFIGGGGENTILNSDYNFIGGGGENVISGGTNYATIGGGFKNRINSISNNSFIGGGVLNIILDGSVDTFIGAGFNNGIYNNGDNSAIVAGLNNDIDNSTASFVGGGGNNDILNSTNSFIGGGVDNTIENSSTDCFIGAGFSNTINNSNYATIVGGQNNSTGGYNNVHILGSTITATADNTTFVQNITASGALSKGSGTFRIPTPIPNETGYLYHSFVESPNAGDNIYRWTIEVTNGTATIELPDYYKHLNNNDMIWVNPTNNFGRGYGQINEEQTILTITTDIDGKYNVLLIGTRKDQIATENWKGLKRDK